MPSETHPEKIRRYQILQELGRGAMGRVYLAEDPRIDRRIALKVFHPATLMEDTVEAEMRQRFLMEAKAAGRLTHPGIVTVYDADTDPESGDPYLAMEWVDGQSLRDIIDRGPIAVDEAVGIAVQVAEALDYAHREKVVHRDVKPENLMIKGNGAVKVTDFGIAKLRSNAMTLPGHILGSPSYMAPEQVRADQVDGRADLFALGSVLYECLTGQVAFGGDSLANVTYKIITDEPDAIETKNATVPPAIRGVVQRAMQKEPEKRYQTGAELAAALREAAAMPPASTVETAAARPARPARPPIDPDLPTEQIRVTTSEAVQVQSVTRPTPMDSEGGRRSPFLLALLVLLGLGALGAIAWTQGWLDNVGSPPPSPLESPELAPEPGDDETPFSVDPSVPGYTEEQLFSEDPASDTVVGESETVDPSLVEGPVSLDDPDSELPDPTVNAQEVVDSQEAGDPEEPLGAEDPVPADAPTNGEDTVELGDTAELEDTVELEESSEVPPPPAATPSGTSQATPSVPPAIVEIVYNNKMKAAYISFFVDGERQFYQRLESGGVMQRTVGQRFQRTVEVPPGARDLEVRFSGVTKDMEASGRLHVNLKSEQFLRLEAVRRRDGMELVRIE